MSATETHSAVATRTESDLQRQFEERPISPNGTHTSLSSWGVRHRLPPERASLTHHFTIGQHDGYLTVGLFPNGEPGEIFVSIAKEGSTLGGLMDSFAKAISVGLQYGVPLELFCAKFSHTRFEPSGWTGNPDLGFANSIMDYIFRWLQLRFIQGRTQNTTNGAPRNLVHERGSRSVDEPADSAVPGKGRSGYHSADALGSIVDLGDAPTCNICGAICVRNGSCFRCLNCGQTTGCG